MPDAAAPVTGGEDRSDTPNLQEIQRTIDGINLKGSHDRREQVDRALDQVLVGMAEDYGARHSHSMKVWAKLDDAVHELSTSEAIAERIQSGGSLAQTMMDLGKTQVDTTKSFAEGIRAIVEILRQPTPAPPT